MGIRLCRMPKPEDEERSQNRRRCPVAAGWFGYSQQVIPKNDGGGEGDDLKGDGSNFRVVPEGRRLACGCVRPCGSRGGKKERRVTPLAFL